MAEPTEVIQHDIQETRADLAEKLAELSDKITGTVESVEQTVENVSEKATETVEAVKQTISGTVETVKESVEGTVESVKDTVSDTFEAVKNTFDLRRQVEERPWLVFGGAVAVGFIAGRLVGSPTRSSRSSSHPSWGSTGRGYGAGYGSAERAQSYGDLGETYRSQQASSEHGWLGGVAENVGSMASNVANNVGSAASSVASNVGSFTSGLTEQFGPELNNLKGLALGALFGLVRDLVTRQLPESLKGQVGEVINHMTERVGGKTIEGHVFDNSESQESSDRGATHDYSGGRFAHEERHGSSSGQTQFSNH